MLSISNQPCCRIILIGKGICLLLYDDYNYFILAELYNGKEGIDVPEEVTFHRQTF